jgi:6-pyruvoyltetrahydropterin/6-carboxytetrahydropterin synthase
VSGTFRVSVSKDYLAFAAAHFITFRGHQCESLHGHNYRLAITIEGALDDEVRWVLDFSDVKRIAREYIAEVDHRVLLPTESDKLVLAERGDRVEVSVFGEPRYVFPARDCARVPIANTTAEELSRYFAERTRAALAARGIDRLTRLEVEVEEGPGQSATYAMALGD